MFVMSIRLELQTKLGPAIQPTTLYNTSSTASLVSDIPETSPSSRSFMPAVVDYHDFESTQSSTAITRYGQY